MKRWFGGLLVVALLLVVAFVALDSSDVTPVANGPLGDETIRWIVAGGGATPESNEVSIEDDLRLARRLFDGKGVTLFASGAQNQAVRVEASDLQQDPLVSELGAIFNPRPGRTSRYRRANIAADGPASPSTVLDALREAAGERGPALDLYLAGHGDQGESASLNTVVMWANLTITPADIAAALSEAKRRTRLVVTTCFSGGFAEIVFKEADASKDAVPADVCGLFASTWDLEAGGCDPDPDRGRHDGYGVHFLSALNGKTPAGEVVEADVGGDGTVSLLDAHTHARVTSGSIDVPTTTSERWLRAVAEDSATVEPLELPHEEFVIEALQTALSAPTEATARAELAKLEGRLEQLREDEGTAIQAETEAYWDLAAALLARWPVLDDPWHPTWSETISRHRAEITEFLATTAHAESLRERTTAVNEIAGRRAELEVRRAPLLRLVRAHENRRLASALAARGGADWERFLEFRACEDSR